MSFLNPVNEPVLRFSSTDASAPQINYNARVAGDVKAILKACLVTGYGSVASAGWSIANEVNHVAEFVSPAVAMSDYRLGIDDTSTVNTIWYYQYQDVRVNPSYNTPVKNFTTANKTHANNGWQLLVTSRGLLFIELVQHSAIDKLSARMTYFSRIKSGINATSGKNIAFFNIGHNGAISLPRYMHASNYTHFVVGDETLVRMYDATPFAGIDPYKLNISSVDLVSPVYVGGADIFIGQIAGLNIKVINNATDLYGLSETTLADRSVLSVCSGSNSGAIATAQSNARTFLIYLDYWEY